MRGLFPALVSLSTKAAVRPSSSLTFFICGMAAVERGSLRFIVLLGIVDDIIEMDIFCHGDEGCYLVFVDFTVKSIAYYLGGDFVAWCGPAGAGRRSLSDRAPVVQKRRHGGTPMY